MAEEVGKFGHIFLAVAYLQGYPRAKNRKKSNDTLWAGEFGCPCIRIK
jgi:hypothetical protein